MQDKYIVPEDAKPWVNKTMSDQFRSYKSRIKRDNYNPYPTDEERLAHRPEEVPLSDWKILLTYWADEKVQVTHHFVKSIGIQFCTPKIVLRLFILIKQNAYVKQFEHLLLVLLKF